MDPSFSLDCIHSQSITTIIQDSQYSWIQKSKKRPEKRLLTESLLREIFRILSQAMKQEVSYATYLSASHLILPRIRHRRYISDYGRAICSILTGLSSSVVVGGSAPSPHPSLRVQSSMTGMILIRLNSFQ
jgi:hypothetical protein